MSDVVEDVRTVFEERGDMTLSIPTFNQSLIFRPNREERYSA
jgi:hypothetical protein